MVFFYFQLLMTSKNYLSPTNFEEYIGRKRQGYYWAEGGRFSKMNGSYSKKTQRSFSTVILIQGQFFVAANKHLTCLTTTTDESPWVLTWVEMWDISDSSEASPLIRIVSLMSSLSLPCQHLSAHSSPAAHSAHNVLAPHCYKRPVYIKNPQFSAVPFLQSHFGSLNLGA